MNKAEISYWLALLRAPLLGIQTFLKIVRKIPSLAEFFQSPESSLKLLPQTLSYLKNPAWKDVEKDWQWAEQADNHHILTLHSEEYPTLLKEIACPPPVLFVKGCLSSLNNPQIAMVGSRKPSPSGKENASQFAQLLGQTGLTITSGLAHGIDTAAHLGALETSQTIAAVGTGLNRCYPKANQALAERISRQGAIVSEFPYNTPPLANHFPRRNRIISGLSLGTLVVEANLQSGSLITAGYAVDQGREVFAIPGNIHNPKAKGCHALIKQGAILVETPEDILEAFNMTTKLNQSSSNNSNASNKGLERDHRKLLECIDYEPTKIDILVERSTHPISKVTAILADLELMGLICSTVSGYMRVSK